MSRATSRGFYLAAIGVALIGLVIAFLVHFVHIDFGIPFQITLYLLAFGVISALLFAIGYIGALIKIARLSQWLWLVLLILFAPVAMLVYIFAGPTKAAVNSTLVNQISPESMKGGIFISYRREDSADICGRIYDHLAARYGRPNVFKDVDSIPYGEDFPNYIQSQLRTYAVCLAIIGPRWLTSATVNGQ